MMVNTPVDKLANRPYHTIEDRASTCLDYLRNVVGTAEKGFVRFRSQLINTAGFNRIC
jgi:hypothetical protein